MLISGFTIARNVIKYNYPIVESIKSILPICDEFIINVGDSEDRTFELMRSIKSDKIRVVKNTWDMSMGKEVLSFQTNLALKECKGDWAFYLQSDEVIHEHDLGKLKKLMVENIDNSDVDAIRFRWLHFYGSYYRYRIDYGWYQKQDRIIRNNGEMESFGDAFGFHRKDGKDIKRMNSGCLLYHYGWVHSNEQMTERRKNAEDIGFTSLTDQEREDAYDYGDLKRFVPYFGSHPQGMAQLIAQHTLSQADIKNIHKQYWYHPFQWLHLRYKTGKRIRHSIK